MSSARVAPQAFLTPTSKARRTDLAVVRLTNTTHEVNRMISATAPITTNRLRAPGFKPSKKCTRSIRIRCAVMVIPGNFG